MLKKPVRRFVGLPWRFRNVNFYGLFGGSYRLSSGRRIFFLKRW